MSVDVRVDDLEHGGSRPLAGRCSVRRNLRPNFGETRALRAAQGLVGEQRVERIG